MGQNFISRGSLACLVAVAGAFWATAAMADMQENLQAELDNFIAERSAPEAVTGISAYVSLGAEGPNYRAYSGTIGKDSIVPVDEGTLFQIGSNTKGFTGALILALEAEGKVDIHDTVGDWLPEYPAWSDVTIEQLLHMTSGLPTYSETTEMNDAFVNAPDRDFTMPELIAMAYPSETVDLPIPEGFFYSNTNYVLAGMIAEKASGMPYKNALEEMLFKPAELTETYYEPDAYGEDVLSRMASGYFNNPDCTLYDLDCEVSQLAPILGRDVKADSVSWAGPAGGIVSTPEDLAKWIRAIFHGKVLPEKQLAEFVTPVSLVTGKIIDDVTDEDPQGFTLGLTRVTAPGMEPVYFYLGMTLGYRAAFLYSPEHDVIVTGATNSQPPGGQEMMTPMLIEVYKEALAAKAAQ
nr:serine hydrolase domain-containing protein [Marinicella sp. W31]MDC2879288.1 serine hydrolase [Marinicella sp. W31]